MQGGTRSRIAKWSWLWLGALVSCGLVACGSDSKSGDRPMPMVGDGGSGGAGGAPDAGSAGEAVAQGGEKAASLDDLLESMGGPAPKADWTVFVYGHADHNLSFSLIRDIQEMQAATLHGKSDVNLIVLADFDASQELPNLDPPEHYPSGTQLYLVPGAGEEPRLIGVDEELDLDDSAQLERVLSIVFAAFPAERRGLVMWDHGGSWSGGFGADSQDGTRSPAPGMAVKDIPGAVLRGLSAAGVDSEPPLDFFTFDTCLMGGAEVAYPLRRLAPVYTANAEIDYGDGWDYATTLSFLANSPGIEPTAFAQAEVSHWDAHHASSSPSDAALRAHIAIDTSQVDALAEAMAALSDAMLSTDGFNVADLARVAYDASPVYFSTFEEGASSPGIHDLGQVLDGLVASTLVPQAVVDAAKQARAALAALTLGTSLGELRAARKQAGFHIELSRGADLSAEKLASYASRASDWAKASGWKQVLDSLAESADQTAPELTHSVSNASEAGPGALPVVTFSTTDSDVQSGRVLLALPNQDGTLTYRGFLGGGLVEPNSDYEFEWDGLAITVGGADAMLLPYIELGSDLEHTVYQVLGVIGSGEDALEVALVFSGTDDAAQAFIATFEGLASTHTLAEVVAGDPDATFTPRLIKIDPVTQESELTLGEPVPIPKNGALPLALTPVAAGSYVLFTQIYDVWGNRSVVEDVVQLVTPVSP